MNWCKCSFYSFSNIMWFICFSSQKFLAPSYWTRTGWLQITPRRPNMKLICTLETRWKLWRKIRTVRIVEVEPGVLLREMNERAVLFLVFRVVVLPVWLKTRLGSCVLPGASGRPRGVRRGWTWLRRQAALPRSRHQADICVSVVWSAPAGELHVTIKAYKAEQQDEISLDLGESIEVIHKLLDGWWVVR